MIRKEMIGKKFGRLTVIKLLEERGNNGKLRYLCECECGNTHITSGDSIRSGKSKSCGCLKKEFIEKNKFERTDDREKAILKVQYAHIKRRNRLKGFRDIMTFDEFCQLSKSKCYYCGIEYSKEIEDCYNETKSKGRISDTVVRINGIDRIDSNKGYTIDNVVACCKYCNTAKSTMTQEEFKQWIKRIYEYYVK